MLIQSISTAQASLEAVCATRATKGLEETRGSRGAVSMHRRAGFTKVPFAPRLPRLR